MTVTSQSNNTRSVFAQTDGEEATLNADSPKWPDSMKLPYTAFREDNELILSSCHHLRDEQPDKASAFVFSQIIAPFLLLLLPSLFVYI